MRRFGLRAALAAILIVIANPASAWLAYPPDDQSDRLIVEIDRQVADVVTLKSLPAPFDAALSNTKVASKLSYRWRYDRSAQGKAALIVGESGRGHVRFDFAAREDGIRYGAAIVLLGAKGEALHTFYALTNNLQPPADDPDAKFVGQSIRLDLVRPPRWWRGVAAIRFQRMSYHPLQRLDDQGMRRAMRRAVWHFTRGQGTEQRG